tara:strand:- start:1482 stop:1622 length:141 start_codon:yes stop_codon:yes gene_type:complete
MNNLVKFLILNFLILYPYSLNAEEEKNAQLKLLLENLQLISSQNLL